MKENLHKNKFGKIVLALICLCLTFGCVGTIVGCGKTDDDGTKAIITVGMLSSEKSSFERVEKAYEALHSDVDIRINAYTNYETAMTGYVKNGNWPDIVWTAGDQHAGYSGAGHFLNLKEFDAADDDFSFDTAGIYPELLESTHYSPTDTGYWFMPRDYNVPIIFVNRKHFEKAGINFDDVKAHWNYEKFIEVCNTLKSAYASANAKDTENIRHGFLPTSYPLELDAVKMSNFTGILLSYGGKMLDSDGKNIDDICAFTSDESVAAYERFYETFYAPSAKLVDPSDTTASLFNQKKAAMVLAVRPAVAAIPSGLEYDFLPNPFPYTGVGCGGYAITAKADKKTFGDKKISDYAWEFLKYLVSEDGQNVLSEKGLVTPCIQALKNSGVWTTYGNTQSAVRNHTAFTEYGGTKVGLNDAKLFAPSFNASVDKELTSLVTFCVQYKGTDFQADYRAKAADVLGRMRTYTLA